uniref:Uncharacterized protein n=1 Tax=Arundo donax TaxID=35708 RepID=A0A0A9B471_ARUDO
MEQYRDPRDRYDEESNADACSTVNLSLNCSK